MDFKNKKIGILGLGEENTALVKYLASKKAIVTICDQKEREELGTYLSQIEGLDFDLQLGAGYPDDLKNFDIIFRTPGLPYLDPKIQEAKKAGVEITSQIKLFMELCPSPILGVTGTKGKGTTATLISEILAGKSEIRNPKSETKHRNVYLGGNIGTPPITFLDKLSKNDLVVLELSSFQLQDLKKSPHIAVVLDIKSDHLDYHSGRNEYVEAKKTIVEHQTEKDFAVINADYLTSFEFAVATSGQSYFFSLRKSVDLGAFRQKDKIILRTAEKDIEIIDISKIQLRGEHNLENICAAIAASYLAGADIEAIKDGVKNFKGLEHRLELVAEQNGTKFYNDSFSTTPDTTIAAIRSFPEPIILLLGGSEKNADYSELAKVISEGSTKMIIPIGLTADRIIKEVNNPAIKIIDAVLSMKEAVMNAKESASAGDIVLLSPASASFDRYKNYKERGNIFKEFVKSQ